VEKEVANPSVFSVPQEKEWQKHADLVFRKKRNGKSEYFGRLAGAGG
jgi:hypothetical protein